MDLFDQALQNLNSSSFTVDRTAILARERREQQKLAQIARVDAANERVLANPQMLDSRIAGVVSELSPSASKPKYGKFATRTDAVDANMPEDHPLYGLANKVKNTYQTKLIESQGTGTPQSVLEREALAENINDDLIQQTFEYKAKKDSSWRNAFGVFGEDKDIVVPEALKADYDNWKQGIMDKRTSAKEYNEDPTAKDYTVNALLGTAAGVGIAAAGLIAAPVAVPAAIAALAVGGITGGALAVPGTYAGRKTMQAYRKTEAGTFHEGDAQDKIIGATVGASLMALGARSSGLKMMAGMGAVGGGIGTVSPDMAFDLAGWIGAEAGVRKLGSVGLAKAMQAGKVSEELATALRADPSARNVVDKFRFDRETKLAEAKITAADMEAAARKVAVDLEASRRPSDYVGAEDALWYSEHEQALGESRQRMSDWLGENKSKVATPVQEASGIKRYSSDVELEGGHIAAVDEMNKEMRYATKGGPNLAVENLSSRTEYPMTGRGKKRVANVPSADIEAARGQMHFNEFLDEMQEAKDAAFKEQVAALREDKIAHEAYSDLFENYVHEGSANEALDRVSLDGLNRAMGDGNTDSWKMLSLGNRVQIVSAEESAAASLQARSVGAVSSADRLEALKKPLIKAMGKASKEAPEEFTKTLQKVAESNPEYMKDGKLNLVQLQQDLAHYGFDSLHQFAFKAVEGTSAATKAPRRFRLFQEATEAIRKAAGSSVTKLGVAGAVGAGAYNFGASDSEAGIITPEILQAIKAEGGKIWNYGMQKLSAPVAEEMIRKVNPDYYNQALKESEHYKKLVAAFKKEKDAKFPSIMNDASLSPAAKASKIQLMHNTLAVHEGQYDAIIKDLTREYTLADVRNIVTDNAPDITWAHEKKILEDIGVDTENGAVTLTGTGNDNFNFGYAESSDMNLYGPGATYSTMGTVSTATKDGSVAGTEDITAGYSQIRGYWNRNRTLESLSDESVNAQAERKDLALKLNNVAKELRDEYKNIKETAPATDLSEHMLQHGQLKTYAAAVSQGRPFKAQPAIRKLLEEKGLPLAYEKKLTGPNTRINYFKSEKPFDIHEYYDPTEFGLAPSPDGMRVPGGQILSELGDTTVHKMLQKEYKEMVPEVNYIRRDLEELDKQGGFNPHKTSLLPYIINILDAFETVPFDTATSGILAIEELSSALIDTAQLFSGDVSSGVSKSVHKLLKKTAELQEVSPPRIANDYLKELGYDAITHVGGVNTSQATHHRVWIPLRDEMVKPFLSVQEKLAEKFNLKHTFSGAAAASAVVPFSVVSEEDQGKAHADSVMATVTDYAKKGLESIASFLGPNEAYGANLEMLTKLGTKVKVSPATAEFLTAKGDSAAAVMKKASDAKLLFKELPKKAISTRGYVTNYMQTAPANEHDIVSIIQGTKQVFPGQNLSTPQFGVLTMFKKIIRGGEFKGSAAVQLAHGQSVVADNIRKHFGVLDNIYDTYGVKLSAENSKAITKHMEAVQDGFESVSLELRTKELALIENNKALKAFEETIGTDKDAASKYAEALEARREVSKSLAADVARLNEQLAPQEEKLTAAYKHLAARYPESRISLAMEDTADFQKYPWLTSVMKPEEQKTVIAMKDMMNQYKERVTEVMGKEHVIEGDYMKHSRLYTKTQERKMSELSDFLDNAGLQGKEILAMTKLHSRTKYSRQFLPDISRNMREYIPDTETRLMNADFWKVGKPGGWDAVRKSSIVQNSPALKSFFDRINDSSRPVEDTMLRRMSTRYATLESTRLLLGLPSAPLKHAMKLVGDMRTFGVGATLSTMPRALGMAGRNFVRGKAEELAAKGIIDKQTAQNLFKNNRELDSFVSSVVNQKGMMDYMTDIEKTYGKASENVFDQIIQPLQNAAGVGIKAVETFDRTTTVLMAMKMAEKRGMTGQQAMYSVYDTILKNNFLSGQLNSSWARDPNIRALMLFQNTPFKIWERRIADAVTTKRDIKTAWGVIRNTELPAAYEELQGIGKFMKQAEISFKKGLITDALTGTKDVFDQSISKQLVKEMILTGAMLTGGSALGVNLHGHLLHAPFFKNDDGDATLSISPIAQAAFKTSAGRKPIGYEDYDPEDHFAAATFLRHWYGTAGTSLIGSKIERLSNNDIPEMYKGSKFKFLFALPDASSTH